jgi:hypothetical protein
MDETTLQIGSDQASLWIAVDLITDGSLEFRSQMIDICWLLNHF